MHNFVQKRPKADRTYHTAKYLKGSCLLWGIFFSKIKDALLQSPGCHIPCSLCFLESQQHCHPNTSWWHTGLVPEGRVTRDVFVLAHVPRGPRWPQEPGLCFPDPAPQTRVTALSQPQPLGAVSFSLTGTSWRHRANATPRKRKQP